MIRTDIAVDIESVRHRYGERLALDCVSLQVASGQIFGLLGPNGSGKSTLFRLVATLVPLQSGAITVCGHDVTRDLNSVRSRIGVVFQSPSLDRKLTALENLQCQGALYGIAGQELRVRIQDLANRMGLDDRLNDRCEKLSGGLKRRVELAKGLLHRPSLLILDEPSTGLDPAARLEFWQALTNLREEYGTTILLTTHLLDEAEKCDCLGILDAGCVVALASPEDLRRETGQMVISVSTREPRSVADVLTKEFGWECTITEDSVRSLAADSPARMTEVLGLLGSRAMSVSVGQPGLEDVFMRKTGRAFADP